jgi:uncharacterized phage-like protein YoqJ
MITAVTGHRPDKCGGYSDANMERLTRFAFVHIEQINPKMVISGMALGWDTACARACLRLNIPLWAAIPFEGQESMWPEESQKTYQNLIAKAQKTTVVCTGGFAAWKMQKRNEFMVDNCDNLLELWNGSSGGTRNCDDYARKKLTGGNIINLWDLWLAIQ